MVIIVIIIIVVLLWFQFGILFILPTKLDLPADLQYSQEGFLVFDQAGVKLISVDVIPNTMYFMKNLISHNLVDSA